MLKLLSMPLTIITIASSQIARRLLSERQSDGRMESPTPSQPRSNAGYDSICSLLPDSSVQVTPEETQISPGELEIAPQEAPVTPKTEQSPPKDVQMYSDPSTNDSSGPSQVAPKEDPVTPKAKPESPKEDPLTPRSARAQVTPQKEVFDMTALRAPGVARVVNDFKVTNEPRKEMFQTSMLGAAPPLVRPVRDLQVDGVRVNFRPESVLRRFATKDIALDSESIEEAFQNLADFVKTGRNLEPSDLVFKHVDRLIADVKSYRGDNELVEYRSKTFTNVLKSWQVGRSIEQIYQLAGVYYEYKNEQKPGCWTSIGSMFGGKKIDALPDFPAVVDHEQVEPDAVLAPCDLTAYYKGMMQGTESSESQRREELENEFSELTDFSQFTQDFFWMFDNLRSAFGDEKSLKSIAELSEYKLLKKTLNALEVAAEEVNPHVAEQVRDACLYFKAWHIIDREIDVEDFNGCVQDLKQVLKENPFEFHWIHVTSALDCVPVRTEFESEVAQGAERLESQMDA